LNLKQDKIIFLTGIMRKTIFLILVLTPFLSSQDTKSLIELETEIRSVSPGNQINFAEFPPVQKLERKKTGLAILYSVLLPGMGELYAESYSSGKYFTIAEGALWGVFIGMNSYANWQKDRYKSFAASRAGIDINGKDDEYYGTISNYVSIEEYNNEKAIERSFDEMYNPSQYFWDWGNQANREQYRSMWLSSEQTFNDVRFVVGAMILNRIASAINAVRLVAAYNKNTGTETSWNLSAGISGPVSLPPSITINVQKNF